MAVVSPIETTTPRSLHLRAGLVAAVVVLLVTPAAGAWTWPADGPVLRTFSLGGDPYTAGQHRGIDVGAPLGAPVRSAAGGVVSFAGAVPGYGRVATIRTADGY